MRIFRICLAIAIVFSLASFASAQSGSKSEEMIDQLLRKVEHIGSYKVDMKIEMPMGGQTITTEAEMAFKKPDMMHMTASSNMMGGMKQETFMKGNILWNYVPIMKMVTKLDISKVKGGMPKLGGMTDITKPFEDFSKDKIEYLEKKTVDDMEVHVFEVAADLPGQTPSGQPAPPMLPKKMVFLINAQNGLPYKIQGLAADGSVMMRQTFSNYRLNIPINDSEFEFTPPEGVQVMDMTEGAMNMMRQMQGSGSKSK